ncbi:MAG: OsmC family protein [Anaerolineae bacterium]|nr:OsmC family protein [Anaerolineae bacterium]
MAALDYYLQRKKQILAQRRADWEPARETGVVRLSASSKLAGNTGARPTRMGEHTMVSDSAPGMAGHGLGPTAPEMLLGALASCLVHTYVIQSCLLDIPFDQVEVEVSGSIDMGPVVGLPYEGISMLEDISYVAHLSSTASPEDVERMHAAVEATCPVLNTLKQPAPVRRRA